MGLGDSFRELNAARGKVAAPVARKVVPLPLQGTAKSKHPDFHKKTVYVRKRTAREAMRKFEDQDGKEFSDLVEMLLQRYVSG